MVYLFLADGFEEIEALAVVDIVRRAEIELTTVAVGDEPVVTGAHEITVFADDVFEAVDFSDATMLILPGGMPGTVNLEGSAELKALLVQHKNEGKPMAAICAAPRILGELGLLNGLKATCYPGNEAKLLGAEFVAEKVVSGGGIITSRGAGTAIEFGLAIVTALKGKEKAAAIGKAIMI